MLPLAAGCAPPPADARPVSDPDSGWVVDTGLDSPVPRTIDEAVGELDLQGATAQDLFAYGDGTADILLSDQRIVSWDGNSLAVARSVDGTSDWRTAVRIPDLDGDGAFEIVASGSYSDSTAYLTVFDGDTALIDRNTPALWDGEYGVYWQTGASLDWEVVEDISGDGTSDFEIVYFWSRYRLVAELWTTALLGHTSSQDLDLFGVRDVDGDGANDRALLSESGLSLLAVDDASIATLAFGAGSDWDDSRGGFATGGDFDGDGHGDVLAVRHDGVVRVLSGPHADGGIDEATVAMLGEAYDASASLLDLRVADDDGDGRADVLYAEGTDGNDGSGALVLFRGPLAGDLDYAASAERWVGRPGDGLGMGAWWIDEGVFATTGAGQLLIFETAR